MKKSVLIFLGHDNTDFFVFQVKCHKHLKKLMMVLLELTKSDQSFGIASSDLAIMSLK